jgi:hypothetical protein
MNFKTDLFKFDLDFDLLKMSINEYIILNLQSSSNESANIEPVKNPIELSRQLHLLMLK